MHVLSFWPGRMWDWGAKGGQSVMVTDMMTHAVRGEVMMSVAAMSPAGGKLWYW